MPRFRLPGDAGDRFEGALSKPDWQSPIPIRGEIAGDEGTPVVTGAFGTPADPRFGPVPSSGWMLSIGPDELRNVQLIRQSANQAGPITVFEGTLVSQRGMKDMSDDIDMTPGMTPEEEDEAAENHRERLKTLGDLPPATDPGEIRARQREKEELERRLKEYEERKRARETGGS